VQLDTSSTCMRTPPFSVVRTNRNCPCIPDLALCCRARQGLAPASAATVSTVRLHGAPYIGSARWSPPFIFMGERPVAWQPILGISKYQRRAHHFFLLPFCCPPISAVCTLLLLLHRRRQRTPLRGCSGLVLIITLLNPHSLYALAAIHSLTVNTISFSFSFIFSSQHRRPHSSALQAPASFSRP
jgi:hypothetical protein